MSLPIAKRSPMRRLALIAAAVAVGFGLTACSGGNSSPGAAAYVNGVEISEKQVTYVVDEWKELTGENLTRSYMTLLLAEADVLLAVGQDVGIEVTDEQVDEFIAMFVEAGASVDPEGLSTYTRNLISYAVLLQAVNNTNDEAVYLQLQDAVNTADVRLNPRYGEIKDGVLVPSGTLGDAFTADSVTEVIG